jgi:hypothetical protein
VLSRDSSRKEQVMIRREAQPMLMLEIEVNHRALRRCHGCGSYARPSAEIEGRLLCERCAEKWRREREADDLNGAMEV